MPDERSGYQNVGERRPHKPHDADDLEFPEFVELRNYPNSDAAAKPSTCKAQMRSVFELSTTDGRRRTQLYDGA